MMSFVEHCEACLAGISYIWNVKTHSKSGHFHHYAPTPQGHPRALGHQPDEALLSQALHYCHGHWREE